MPNVYLGDAGDYCFESMLFDATFPHHINLFFFFEEPLLVPRLFSPSIGMKWVGEDHPTIIPYNLCHVHVISYFKYKTTFDGCEIFFCTSQSLLPCHYVFKSAYYSVYTYTFIRCCLKRYHMIFGKVEQKTTQISLHIQAVWSCSVY